MNFLLRVIINAVAIWFATLVLSGLEVVGGGDTTTTVIVNAAMLWITSWLSQQTEYGLRIDNFGTAVLGALIISIVSFVLSVALKNKR